MATQRSPFVPLTPTISRRTQIVELLGNEIREGVYAPGEKLPTEQELIARFGVSRTVIREAFAALKAEGLLVTRQGSGAFVTENPLGHPFRIAPDEMNSLPQILHVLQLRMAVELEMTGVAALNRNGRTLERMQIAIDKMDDAIAARESISAADYEFHLAIAEGTGNPYFGRFIRFLRHTVSPGLEINPALRDPEVRQSYFTNVQVQHREILRTIRDGDPEGARRIVRAHLEDVLEQYRKLSAWGDPDDKDKARQP